MELADTSAWTNRLKSTTVDVDFAERIVRREIATCVFVVMELLWTARDLGEFDRIRVELQAAPEIPITNAAWDRATNVWRELVARGRQRQVAIPDLIVAAAAEEAGVGLCHYDADFDVIASVTGQPVRAIAPLGSL